MGDQKRGERQLCTMLCGRPDCLTRGCDVWMGRTPILEARLATVPVPNAPPDNVEPTTTIKRDLRTPAGREMWEMIDKVAATADVAIAAKDDLKRMDDLSNEIDAKYGPLPDELLIAECEAQLYVDTQVNYPEMWEKPSQDHPGGMHAVKFEGMEWQPVGTFGGVDWGHSESLSVTQQEADEFISGQGDPRTAPGRPMTPIEKAEYDMDEAKRLERGRLERTVLDEVRTACRVNADYEQGYLSLRQWRKALDRVKVAQEALEAAQEASK